MRFNYKKISAVLTGALMVGLTMGTAAAANYPAPFVSGGSANVAIVYGTGEGVSALDVVQAGNIQSDLQSGLGSGSGPGTVDGGEFVRLDKSSDHINLGNALNGPFGSTVDSEDLPVLLADGIYTADDSDTFDYEQKIVLNGEVFTHFRDSDYERLIGASDRTPALGFHYNSSDTFVMNYTLDFLSDAESDVSSGDLQDIENSDIPLFGKTYYVSDAKNGTNGAYLGTMTLLDSANTGTVSEGETVTVNVGDKSYDVSISFVDSTETVLVVNGVKTNSLNEGETYKLADGTYVGVRNILSQDYQGGIKKVEFSIGSGKLELTHGSDIKLNDDSVSGVKAYLYRGTASSSGTEKIDKIVIEWKTEDESFLTENTDLVIPGFGGMKLSMGSLVRPTEEKVSIQNDGDDSVELTVPIKDGTANFNILYSSTTDGLFDGIGKSSSELLHTSNETTTVYYEKKANADFDQNMVVSYNTTRDSESHLLSFTITEDTGDGRNETTVRDEVTGKTWDNRVEGDTFNLGDSSFTINSIGKNSTDKWMNITAGTGTSFNKIFTAGGLVIYLPVDATNESAFAGAINFSSGVNRAGHNATSFYLAATGEDKDDNIASGTQFSFTLSSNSDNELQVNAINTTGIGAGAGTGGPSGLERGNSKIYEAYVIDDVAPLVVHYTDPTQDYAEIMYPTGDSETYAQVFLTSEDASVSGGSSGPLGDVLVKDSEVSSVATKNLVIVGGSCINSAAATVLGVSDRTCGPNFTSKTGVGSGQFLIQGFNGAFSSGKIALVVAGYEAADTVNAAKYLTTQTVDTSSKYVGTSSTSADLVVA